MSDAFERKLFRSIHDGRWEAIVASFHVDDRERSWRLVPMDQDTNPEPGVIVTVLTAAELAEVERSAAERAWDELVALFQENTPPNVSAAALWPNPHRREESDHVEAR